MGCETYQTVSVVLNLTSITCATRWITTPRLAWSFVTFAQPDEWEPTFTYLRFRRAPEADFEVGGRRYGVFAHDWRAEPAPAWLDRMGEREIATNLTLNEIAAPSPPPLLVLSRSEFAQAVRQALRDYTRPAALAANPLLRSRLTAERADGAPTPVTLQCLLGEAAESLRGNPKGEKPYRALHRTYLEPAASQELAAELLGLPFNTYRYQLAGAVAQVTEWLWRLELYGPAG